MIHCHRFGDVWISSRKIKARLWSLSELIWSTFTLKTSMKRTAKPRALAWQHVCAIVLQRLDLLTAVWWPVTFWWMRGRPEAQGTHEVDEKVTVCVGNRKKQPDVWCRRSQKISLWWNFCFLHDRACESPLGGWEPSFPLTLPSVSSQYNLKKKSSLFKCSKGFGLVRRLIFVGLS